ncbi:MAG: hypothetical protein ACP5DC_03925 [Halothiobacillaceae bacterium]
MSGQFTLQSGRWYGWQMMPGYMGLCVPFYSPIYVEAVTPRKTGAGLLTLQFVNMAYAEGVRNFQSDMRVLVRRDHYLMASLVGYSKPRDAVICEITFKWLKQAVPILLSQHPVREYAQSEETNVQDYLDAVFRPDRWSSCARVGKSSSGGLNDSEEAVD